MTNPIDRFADQSHDYLKIIMEQTSTFGSRIGAWLLLGNVGALVVVYSAVMGGTSCDRDVLSESLRYFVAGSAVAFGGTLVAYFGSAFGMISLSKLAQSAAVLASNDFETREMRMAGREVQPGSHIEADGAAALAALMDKRPGRILIGAVAGMILLYLTSAGLFGAGILVPLTAPAEAMASCVNAATAR